MRKLYFIKKYFQHQLRAASASSIENQSVKDTITNIIKRDKRFYIFSVIESLRAQMLLSSDSIHVEDYGTGISGNRKVKSIATKSLKSAKHGQMLFRLVNHLQAKTILELGTSLGITTLYLSKVSENSRVITLEGSYEIANIALKNFRRLKANNIELVQGDFKNTLPEALAKLNLLDLCFIDGNHSEKPTLDYFNQVVDKCNEAAVIVIDDIHWSKEMTGAWRKIQDHSKAWVSVELFNLGMVFLKPGTRKEYYKIRC
ncbi:MAG: SAM-dependent methyltransferase [Bacteroidetes bacterium]|nr:MAG: SAM-dependent methyltransferase [Bacteroidota bacterium]